MQSSTTFISRAIKRVLRDLDEIQRDPIPGLALCMPDKNDPFTLHGNIEVKDGIYEGILLHLVFHIPEEYPIKPPAVNIAPGLDFGYKYHAHVYDNSIHGNSICTDLTSNFAGHFSNIDAHGKPTKSGWTPAYTLSSVLMQLQVFFADPDKPKEVLPSEEKIKKLKDHISKYQLDIRTFDDENGVQIVTHSFEKPYPPLSSIPAASIIEIISDEKEICEDKVEREPQLKAVNVKKEEIDISRSTAYSVTRNQSNNSSNDNQSSNSSSSERKQELLEELKEEEEVKVDIVSGKKVTGSTVNQNRPLDEHRSNFSSSNSISEIEETKTLEPQQINSWGKPLKKVSKEEAGKNSKMTKTVVVTVQKPLPPSEPEIEVWPLRSQEKPKAAPRVANKEKNETDEQRAFRRAEKISVNSSMSHKVEETKVPEPQQSATGWRTSLINRASQPTTQTTDAPIRRFYNSQRDKIELGDLGLQLRQELKVENDPFFIKDNIYKQTITQNKMTAPQIINDISNKLVCSVTKTDVFDSSKPILGYPIDLEKDHQGRLWPTPIMELLSYDAFVFNIQQNFDKLDNYHQVKFTSSFGSQYNYWLPVYVDEAHFERGKQYIFNAIAIIYSGVEGKQENDFHPLMVLKVLPPILVKTAIHFIMGTIHQSVVGIDAYCQLYRLFVKLVEMFPELQEAIDNEVKNFCKSDANRHKKIAGDLGDFFVKLTLFSKGSNNKEAINHVFNEHFTRQVFWAGKADGGLAFREHNCPNFLQRFMLATQVSNKFFLTKLEIARLLLDEDVKSDLEKRCGLLNDATMKLFRERLGWIQKNIAEDWKVFVVAAGQESFVYNEQTMFACAKKAFEAAKSKGYMT